MEAEAALLPGRAMGAAGRPAKASRPSGLGGTAGSAVQRSQNPPGIEAAESCAAPAGLGDILRR